MPPSHDDRRMARISESGLCAVLRVASSPRPSKEQVVATAAILPITSARPCALCGAESCPEDGFEPLTRRYRKT